jgi:peptidoglycan/LPS O-acetylase OafA/YrhL
VALDHAGVRFLQGGYVGVDVFFVLSGYLITGLLVSAAEKVRSREYFSSFYARRARRILPAATLTLVVTDIAASHLLNVQRAHEVLVDSISSAFFVANFHFASIGTNYFSMGQPPSPLQHFWSLSVEEQFYVVWPLLVAIALLGLTLRVHRVDQSVGRRSSGLLRGLALSRRRGRLHMSFNESRLRVVAVITTGASFAYAVYDTHHSAAAAYFSSPARAWELGLGATLALNVGRLAQLTAKQLAVLGWLGAAAILAASTLYSGSTPFPGLAALVPTLGAAAVIAAGLRVDQARFAPSRVLSLRPCRYLGDRSYTFYLWHWPVLILAMEHTGHSLSVSTNLLLLVGAFALSIGTYALFENPVRQTSKLQGAKGLVLWPAAIATILFITSINWSSYQDAVNLASYSSLPQESLTEASQTSEVASTQGAHSLWSPSSPSALVAAVTAVRDSRSVPSSLDPSPLVVSHDLYQVPRDCIAEPGEIHSSSLCNLGASASTKMLAVVGDSHAQMWMPGILSFAEHHGYDVRPFLHSGCNAWRWSGVERTSECVAWYKWVLPQIRALHPSLLILGTHYDIQPLEGEIEFTGPNSIANISVFGAALKSSVGHIVVLGDPPGQDRLVPECLLAPRATMKACSSSPTSGQLETIAGVESVVAKFGSFLNTTPWLCYQQVCPMVVGHSVVYREHDHITRTFGEELAPLFSAALTRVLAGSDVTEPTRHSST